MDSFALFHVTLKELWRALKQLSCCEEEDVEGDDELVVDVEDAILLRDYLAQKLKYMSQYESRFM